MVKLSRRGDSWHITDACYDHGTPANDFVAPCLGSRKPSAKDLIEDRTFAAMLNSQDVPATRRSALPSKSISATMAQKQCFAREPSVDVVKKARAAHGRRGKLMTEDHMVDLSELRMVLEAVQEHNPTFGYKVNVDANGMLNSVFVIMPYASAVLAAGYKIIGIDGAHGKEVEVGDEGELLSKVHIVSICSRGGPIRK